MRCDESIKLKCSDITFNEQGMVVNVLSSKTDQLEKVHLWLLPTQVLTTCPVPMMEDIMSWLGLSHPQPKGYSGPL